MNTKRRSKAIPIEDPSNADAVQTMPAQMLAALSPATNTTKSDAVPKNSKAVSIERPPGEKEADTIPAADRTTKSAQPEPLKLLPSRIPLPLTRILQEQQQLQQLAHQLLREKKEHERLQPPELPPQGPPPGLPFQELPPPPPGLPFQGSPLPPPGLSLQGPPPGLSLQGPPPGLSLQGPPLPPPGLLLQGPPPGLPFQGPPLPPPGLPFQGSPLPPPGLPQQSLLQQLLLLQSLQGPPLGLPPQGPPPYLLKPPSELPPEIEQISQEFRLGSRLPLASQKTRIDYYLEHDYQELVRLQRNVAVKQGAGTTPDGPPSVIAIQAPFGKLFICASGWCDCNGNLLSLNEAFGCEPGPLTASFENAPSQFLDTDIDPRVFAALMKVFNESFMKWLLGEDKYKELLTTWPVMLMWHIAIDTLKKFMRSRPDVVLVQIDNFNRRTSVTAELRQSLLDMLDPNTRRERLGKVKAALETYREQVDLLHNIKLPKFNDPTKQGFCDKLQTKIEQHEATLRQANNQPLEHVWAQEALQIAKDAIDNCQSLHCMIGYIVHISMLENVYSRIVGASRSGSQTLHVQVLGKYIADHWEKVAYLLSSPQLPPANELSVDIGVVQGHVSVCMEILKQTNKTPAAP